MSVKNIPESRDSVISIQTKNTLGQLNISGVRDVRRTKGLVGDNDSVSLVTNTPGQVCYCIGPASFKTYVNKHPGIVSGATFKEALILTETSAVFSNCVFLDRVAVTSGKVTLLSCVLDAGITNSGTIADVNLIGCLFLNGSSGVNVTELATV